MTMTLRRLGASEYASPDGRYLLERQPYERDCECAGCTAYGICPRDGITVEWQWHVWDTQTGDYAEGTGPGQFETLRDARAWLARRTA